MLQLGRKTAPAAQPPRATGSRAAANRSGLRRSGSRLETPANRSGTSGSRLVLAVTARPRVRSSIVIGFRRRYFQRELERAKKLTAQRVQEKLRKEKAAAEGNYPGGDEAYDEEAELQRALNQSRAEEEFRRGVQQRGGAYEHGGGSGTRGEGTLQRMLRRATSARQTPGVTDYNLGSARGSTQPRIDTGSWTQKDEDDDEGDTPLPSNIVADKINPADLRKRKYHIAPSKVIPKRQRGQATGKGKQKEIEVLSDEDTDDGEGDKSPEYQESQDSSSGDDGDDDNDGDGSSDVVAAVAVLLAVAGADPAEACHLQTHLLEFKAELLVRQGLNVMSTAEYEMASRCYLAQNRLHVGFEFNRFPPVPGQTGPVNRYRRPAFAYLHWISPDRTSYPVEIFYILRRGRVTRLSCQKWGSARRQLVVDGGERLVVGSVVEWWRTNARVNPQNKIDRSLVEQWIRAAEYIDPPRPSL
nr:unnamed protein product [Digitaria exilis]